MKERPKDERRRWLGIGLAGIALVAGPAGYITYRSPSDQHKIVERSGGMTSKTFDSPPGNTTSNLMLMPSSSHESPEDSLHKAQLENAKAITKALKALREDITALDMLQQRIDKRIDYLCDQTPNPVRTEIVDTCPDGKCFVTMGDKYARPLPGMGCPE